MQTKNIEGVEPTEFIHLSGIYLKKVIIDNNQEYKTEDEIFYLKKNLEHITLEQYIVKDYIENVDKVIGNIDNESFTNNIENRPKPNSIALRNRYWLIMFIR